MNRPRDMTQKRCPKCGETKPLSAFSKNVSKKDKLSRWCKKCICKEGKKCYAENPEKYRQRRRERYRERGRPTALRYNYGITPEQYEALLVVQNGVCAICEQTEIRRIRGRVVDLSVDHDHKTRKVRALLCTRCNMMLGCSQDNPERLEKAATYLRFHQK